MKRIITFFLIVLLLTGVCLANNGGDPNIEGGGGEMGGGSGDSYWSPGNDGVRVTIIHEGTPVYIMDMANGDYSSAVQTCFKKISKLCYMNGTALTPKFDGAYHNFIPVEPLPTIINKNGGSNIERIRSYFTDKGTAEFIASKAGMTLEDLTDGSYKLLLEPISYFKYKGVMYAMTATETALYDQKVNGDLKYWMGTLTHQNQPFSMFLQRTDLGIRAWSGGTSGKQANDTIISSLGVGIVSFKYSEEQEPTAPDLPAAGDPSNPITGNGTYRTDTDVVTSVLVRPSSDITPDDNAYVTFDILGRTYSKQFVCPAGSSQLVWIRWHTPTTPQDININVRPWGEHDYPCIHP